MRVKEKGRPRQRERGSSRGLMPCWRVPADSVVRSVNKKRRMLMKGILSCRRSIKKKRGIIIDPPDVTIP
jgi:hypothetical protein